MDVVLSSNEAFYMAMLLHSSVVSVITLDEHIQKIVNNDVEIFVGDNDVLLVIDNSNPLRKSVFQGIENAYKHICK
jgi:phosphoheptose isomerase